MTSYTAIVASPIGNLGIRIEANTLSKIDFLPNTTPLQTAKDPLTQKIITELQAYFADSTIKFTIPVTTHGTAFQQKVWQAMLAIPRGQTLTYGQVATRLKSSPRAVGNACRANPVPIVIPCHRIVGGNSLGGYSGATSGSLMDIKSWLLGHEAS